MSCQISYKTQNISASFCYSLDSEGEQKGRNVRLFSWWISLCLHCCTLLLLDRAFTANCNRGALQIIRSAWFPYNHAHLILRSSSVWALLVHRCCSCSCILSHNSSVDLSPCSGWSLVFSKVCSRSGLLEHMTCDSPLLGLSGNVPSQETWVSVCGILICSAAEERERDPGESVCPSLSSQRFYLRRAESVTHLLKIRQFQFDWVMWSEF